MRAVGGEGVADAAFISEGMTSLQTTLEGLFKWPEGSGDPAWVVWDV